MKVISLLLLLSSCATVKQPPKDMNLISNQSIKDLSRSSYLKGCVDGIKQIIKKKTYGNTFEWCRTKAKLHENDISEIIK